MRTLVCALALLATPALAQAPAAPAAPAPAAPPAEPPPVDMRSWESATVGAIFGKFCGYYPDRITPTGQYLMVKSYAECKALFDKRLKSCEEPIKKSGRWKLGNGAQAEQDGIALGRELGTCLGDGLEADTSTRRLAAAKAAEAKAAKAAKDAEAKAAKAAAKPEAKPVKAPAKGK